MRPSQGRVSLWPLAVIIIIMALGVLTITPKVELKANPPAGFVALRTTAGTPKTAVANGYWDVAAHVIQWKYNRGSALPEQVPAEFSLPNDIGKTNNIEDRAARVAYWEKLREEWLRPESWRTFYSIDLDWITTGAQTLWRQTSRFF
jgi:hypothetical protein